MPIQAWSSQRMPRTPSWWVLAAVGTGTFMSALDISVINAVLPVLQRTFAGDPLGKLDSIQWVTTIYLLTVSGLLLGFGRLGDLRGHRHVYLSGFTIFIAGSILCGLAFSVSGLLAARMLQAVGAAMLSATSPAILTGSFPPRQRGQVLGLQATMTYLGLMVGPALGGWLTEAFTWRAAFFINGPIGLLALLLSLRFIPRDAPTPGQRVPFDGWGALFFLLGITSLLVGLNQGYAWGWGSLRTWSLLMIASLWLGLFLFQEQHNPAPMFDLRLFSSQVFRAAVASGVLNYMCVYSILFLIPFYLIHGRHWGPSQSGLILSSMPLMMAIVAPISGSLSDRLGARGPQRLGMAVLASGLLLLAQLGPTSARYSIIAGLCLAGSGIGIFLSPNNSALMGAAPQERRGAAAGMMATARNVGMAFGVGLAGAVLTTLAGGQTSPISSQLFPAIQASFQLMTGIALLGLFCVR